MNNMFAETLMKKVDQIQHVQHPADFLLAAVAEIINVGF